MSNLPTVSDPAAMRDFPNARDNERNTLLEYVHLWPGMRILDFQAAGGYLADEVYRCLSGQVECLCLEPSDALRVRLSPAYEACADPVHAMPSIPDASVDAVLGLVCLHHSDNHEASLAEAVRVLKPDGELAICEVEADSPQAIWLNEFVDRHCPSGHHGNFPHFGYIESRLARHGLESTREERREVPWIFPRQADIAPFLKGLFGLSLDDATLANGIDHYLCLHENSEMAWLDWRLIYAYGHKPAHQAEDGAVS